MEPELRDEVARRARTEGVTVSELIRRAVRHYLESA
ncbi:MAG: ribbon-helix-helix protein, CopG family [Acidimicrobiales bacterium]